MKRGRVIGVRLVVFLLLGAVVNVLMAWILVTRPFMQRADDYEWYERIETPGGAFTLIRVSGYDLMLGQFIIDPPTDYASGDLIDEPKYQSLIPRWSRFGEREPVFEHTLRDSDGRQRDVYIEYATGWPLKTVRFYGPTYSSMYSTGWSRVTGYIELPENWFPSARSRQLPYLPVWPNFAVNTLFYALVLRLLWSAPFTARRVIRRRRGRCVRCGYDLTGTEHDACPECGGAAKGGKCL